MSKTLFISDLHLHESQPSLTEALLNLLEVYEYYDALYILGDLFDAWIGDDYRSLFTDKIISALKQATTQGLPIFYLHGNRDFLLGKQFLQATGCQLLADETLITVYGESALVMHGDTLCTQDKSYQRARYFLRNKLLQALFLKLPLATRLRIATKMRTASLKHTSSTALYLMDANPSEVNKKLQQYHTQTLIHGHTHQPGIHDLNLQTQRIVLGAWHEHASILVWDKTGHKQLINLPLHEISPSSIIRIFTKLCQQI